MALFGPEISGRHADVRTCRAFGDALAADCHRVVDRVDLDLFVVHFEFADAALKTCEYPFTNIIMMKTKVTGLANFRVSA